MDFGPGYLAPLQFVVFLVSLGFVLNYLLYGTYESAASVSVVMKTSILCLIMVTGSIWEKAVFDKYLFAKPFYWEDVVSIVVVFLHLLYLFVYFFDFLSVESQLYRCSPGIFCICGKCGAVLFKFKQARDQTPRIYLLRCCHESWVRVIWTHQLVLTVWSHAI